MRWRSLLSSRTPPRVYRLADGLRVYAVGDVHGRADLLGPLERRIARDVAAHPPPAETLVMFLGDYVDRGPASAMVVERLSRGGFAGLTTRCLLGNHEDALLAFLANPLAAAAWLDWGGEATLASYGVVAPIPRDAASLRAAAVALAEAMPLAHHAFLRELEISAESGDFLFVHAGVRPGVALDRQRRGDLLGIREPFLGSERLLSHRVVHGHTIAPAVEVLPHRVGVDTGAFATGRLSAVAIEGAAVRVLPE